VNRRILNEKKCQVCGRYDNRPLSIDAVIVKDGQLLLIKRGFEPYKGYWALPGGMVEYEETVEETVAREVLEETGLKVISLRLIGVFSKPNRHPRQAVAIAYKCEVEGEALAGDDAADLKYFSLNQIPGKLAFDHRDIIKNTDFL